jgi:hypothetical protein
LVDKPAGTIEHSIDGSSVMVIGAAGVDVHSSNPTPSNSLSVGAPPGTDTVVHVYNGGQDAIVRTESTGITGRVLHTFERSPASDDQFSIGMDTDNKFKLVAGGADIVFAADQTTNMFGIGTDSPATALHVLKNQSTVTTVRVENEDASSSADARVLITSAGADAYIGYEAKTNTGTAKWSAGVDTNNHFRFVYGISDFNTATADATKMQITDAGDVFMKADVVMKGKVLMGDGTVPNFNLDVRKSTEPVKVAFVTDSPDSGHQAELLIHADSGNPYLKFSHQNPTNYAYTMGINGNDGTFRIGQGAAFPTNDVITVSHATGLVSMTKNAAQTLIAQADGGQVVLPSTNEKVKFANTIVDPGTAAWGGPLDKYNVQKKAVFSISVTIETQCFGAQCSNWYVEVRACGVVERWEYVTGTGPKDTFPIRHLAIVHCDEGNEIFVEFQHAAGSGKSVGDKSNLNIVMLHPIP